MMSVVNVPVVRFQIVIALSFHLTISGSLDITLGRVKINDNFLQDTSTKFNELSPPHPLAFLPLR